MKVLGICGSPRRGSNSEILLEHALGPFQEQGWTVVKFLCCERRVAPCDGCESCVETGKCILEDDMAILYEEYAACDAVLIASPVYYRNVTAQLKAVFDRSFATQDRRPLADKPGGAMAVGRGTGGGQSLVLSTIHNFLLSSSAICIPGELNGVSAVADKPGDILGQPKRLRQARRLGENVLRWAALRTRPGTLSGSQ